MDICQKIASIDGICFPEMQSLGFGFGGSPQFESNQLPGVNMGMGFPQQPLLNIFVHGYPKLFDNNPNILFNNHPKKQTTSVIKKAAHKVKHKGKKFFKHIFG